jgi:hypothetical protein
VLPLVTVLPRFTVPLWAPIGTPEPAGLVAGPFLAPIGTPDPADLPGVAFLAPIGTPDPALVTGPVGGLWFEVGSLLTDPVLF